MNPKRILLNGIRRTLWAFLALVLPLFAQGAEFVQVVSRSGADLGLTQTPASQTWIPTPFTVYEQFFGGTPPTGTVNTAYITGILKIKDDHRMAFPGNWMVTITYDIELYDETDTQVGTIPGETMLVTYYKKKEYTDHALKKYQSLLAAYHKAVVSITQIQVCDLDDDGNTITCNTVNALDDLPITMEWQCTSVYQLAFFTAATPPTPTHFVGGSTNPATVCSNSNAAENIIRLGWDYMEGAESYDVEWLFLDIPPTTSPYTLPSASQNFPFDWQNATRVNVTGNFYDVPLLYPTGIIVYRIRGVGLDAMGWRLEGQWSREAPSGTEDNLNLTSEKFVFCGMERGLNWTATLTFAEEGKRKGVVSFVDGTGRARQTITTLNTDQNTIVGEPSLDFMGRPSVNYLPVPVRNEQYGYFTNFNEGFDADFYDTDASYPAANDVQVAGIPGGSNSAVNDFYSINNPFLSLSSTPYEEYLADLTKRLADADDYPFAQTRTMNDGSGRPHSTSGVGSYHALNGKHDTQYYYGTPGSQAEIDRLFGSEAGFVSYYKKNMVMDPNGQLSVTYVDGYGRTVATALAGTQTEKMLDPIPAPAPQTFTSPLLGNNELLSDGTYTATKDIVVSSPTTYHFTYSLSLTEFGISPCTDEYPCQYEFLITVKDGDGNEKNPDAEWKTITLGTTQPYELEVALEPGKYTITKAVRIREAYLDEALEDIDIHLGNSWQTTESTCFTAPYVMQGCMDCSTLCENAYRYSVPYDNNTYLIYRNLSSQGGKDYTYIPGLAADVLDVNGEPLYELISVSDPIIVNGDNAVDACQDKCNGQVTVNMGTECEMKRILLLRDLLPDGQYFENRPQDPEYSGVDNVLYNTGSESNPANRNAWLEAYAADLKDDFGALLNPPITSPTWEDIRTNWETIDPNDPDFADLKEVLIARHPEYCLYRAFCEAGNAQCNCPEGHAPLYGSPQEYENLMANTIMDADAKALFLFAPAGYDPVITGYTGGYSTINYYNKDDVTDPCFADPLLYCNEEYRTDVQNRLLNHLTVTVGGTPVPISIWYLLDDPQNLRLHNLALGSHPTYPDDFVEYIQLLHGSPANPTGGLLAPYNTAPTGSQMTRWQYFRSVYLFHRTQIKYQLAMLSAISCMDCSGTPSPGVPEHPMCEELDGCGGSSCEKVPFFSQWDYDDDGNMDMGEGANGFLFNGMELRYPYIGLLDGEPTVGNLQADHCETQCSALATQWINQMQNGILSCVTQGTDPNNPSLVTTPTFVIPEVDKQMLRAYFVNICSRACTDQASAMSYTHDYTQYPMTGSDWAGSQYTMGANYNGNPIGNVNDVVKRYMQYSGAEGCPLIGYSTPVAGVGPPSVNDLSCSCDNLAYFLSSSEGILKPGYLLINPLKWATLGVSNSTVFDLSELRAHILDSDVSPNNLTDLQSLSSGNMTALVMHWIESCNNNSSIPEITLGGHDFVLPAVLDCSDNADDDYPAEQGCEQTESEQANNVNGAAFGSFKSDMLQQYESGYRANCLSPANMAETFTMTYELNEYHYTLYYYDQAGNLIKTVPPAGVALVDQSLWDDIETYRLAHHHEEDYTEDPQFIWPAHSKISNYIYNAQNQVVQQTTPDAGTTVFFYDALGRLVLSQNAQQTADGNLSYTLFDAIGRTVEVGQIAGVPGYSGGRKAGQLFVEKTATTPGDPTPFEAAVETNKLNKTDITVTLYDMAYTYLFGFTTTPFAQENLLNRVATSLYFSVYPNGLPGGSTPLEFYDNASHYSYDIHGNVKRFVQDIPVLQESGRRLLFTDYDYDLVSGKVNEVHFMKGFAEQFSHYYHYDADNRLISAYTSQNGGTVKELEAKYFYYPTGLLARTELGRAQVQGMDYAYTAHGWLKAMNADEISTALDLGHDGLYDEDNLHSLFGADASGFSLGYYYGDYRSIGTLPDFVGDLPDYYSGNMIDRMHPDASTMDGWGLYNGNISKMVTAGLNCGEKPMEILAQAYRYDQLNRIKASSTFVQNNVTDLQTAPPYIRDWSLTPLDSRWNTEYEYDADGNILSLYRDGDMGPMDAMPYYYTGPESNRLDYIHDHIPDNDYAHIDIDAQTAGNYKYDLNGNLVKDRAGHINNIKWTAYGKVRSVTSTYQGAANNSQWFMYNPAGQRVMKVSGTDDPATLNNKYAASFYALDAQGNVMAVYEYVRREEEDIYDLSCKDQMVYGSSRIGVLHRNLGLCEDCVDITPTENSKHIDIMAGDYAPPMLDIPHYPMEAKLGTREYELTNHLGNVLATVADRKTFLDDDVLGSGPSGIVFQYRPDVLTATDYYPFGMQLPGRHCPNETPCEEVTGEAQVMDYDVNFDTHPASWTVFDPGYAWYLFSDQPTQSEDDRLVLHHSDSEGTLATGYALLDVDGSGPMPITLPAGETYYFEFDVDLGNCGSLDSLIFSVTNSGNTPNTNYNLDISAGGHITGNFTANSNDSYFIGINMYGNDTCTAFMDNFKMWHFEDVLVQDCDYSNVYRYGFNGQEKENDLHGEGNAYAFEYRIYDPRIGKFLSVDPLTQTYPFYTPYSFAANQPIHAIDIEGLENKDDLNLKYAPGYEFQEAIEDGVVNDNPGDYVSAVLKPIDVLFTPWAQGVSRIHMDQANGGNIPTETLDRLYPETAPGSGYGLVSFVLETYGFSKLLLRGIGSKAPTPVNQGSAPGPSAPGPSVPRPPEYVPTPYVAPKPPTNAYPYRPRSKGNTIGFPDGKSYKNGQWMGSSSFPQPDDFKTSVGQPPKLNDKLVPAARVAGDGAPGEGYIMTAVSRFTRYTGTAAAGAAATQSVYEAIARPPAGKVVTPTK